jgi:Phage P2 GpE
VEEAMADIAIIFHWQPSAFDDMGLTDLLGWHAKAIARLKAKHAAT